MLDGSSISIHAPQWGATPRWARIHWPPRISIHAPQWGATQSPPHKSHTAKISIHAPQWGATVEQGDCRAGRADFNPRTPVGCDNDKICQNYMLRISIHAPQWGATRNQIRLKKILFNFNPRTPVGCDKQLIYDIAGLLKFQSTHPSGVRLYTHHPVSARVGISIHAPQWGATFAQLRAIMKLWISIHAPQWGATARMGIAFHNMEAPSVLKTDFIAKIHVHRSIHKFSNQKHQQTIHF